VQAQPKNTPSSANVSASPAMQQCPGGPTRSYWRSSASGRLRGTQQRVGDQEAGDIQERGQNENGEAGPAWFSPRKRLAGSDYSMLPVGRVAAATVLSADFGSGLNGLFRRTRRWTAVAMLTVWVAVQPDRSQLQAMNYIGNRRGESRVRSPAMQGIGSHLRKTARSPHLARAQYGKMARCLNGFKLYTGNFSLAHARGAKAHRAAGRSPLRRTIIVIVPGFQKSAKI